MIDGGASQTVTNVCYCVTTGSCAGLSTGGGGVIVPPGPGTDGSGGKLNFCLEIFLIIFVRFLQVL